MRGAFVAIALMIGALSVTVDSAGAQGCNANNSSEMSMVDPDDGAEQWRTESEWTQESLLLHHDGRLIAATSDIHNSPELFAVDAEDGRELWSTDLPDDYVNDGPAMVDGVVVLLMGQTLRGYDPTSGSELWAQSTGASSSTRIETHEGLVFVFDGTFVVAFQARDGQERWRRETTDDGSNEPMVERDMVFMGQLRGPLLALDPMTGEVLWEGPAPAQKLRRFDVLGTGGGQVIVVDSPRRPDAPERLVAIDLESQKVTWSRDLRGDYYYARMFGDLVFDSAQRLFAIDSRTGEVRWRYRPSSENSHDRVIHATRHADGVFVRWTRTNRVRVLDARSGATKWATRVEGRLIQEPVIQDDVVYQPLFRIRNYYGGDGNTGGLAALRLGSGEPLWSVSTDKAVLELADAGASLAVLAADPLLFCD
ncbi:MAG TPA: PQQ-binding-like beta-propeller repeat protein [Actinomycetota bacterium]|nr:PQQ-binding-like beta-propeller repeat protein [Actinomycetota bacterium]